MKTIIIAAVLCLTSSISFAQNPILNDFYQKYTSYENVTDIKLQGWLLELASEFTDEEQANKLLEKITHLRVLVMEEGNLVSPKDYKRLKTHISQDAFEELFTVKEEKDDIGLYIREKGQSITDVLLLINGEDSFVLLSLEGLFKFSDLNDLKIDVKGMEHLERLPDDKKSVPRA